MEEHGDGIWKEMGGMRKQRRRRGEVMNRKKERGVGGAKW